MNSHHWQHTLAPPQRVAGRGCRPLGSRAAGFGIVEAILVTVLLCVLTVLVVPKFAQAANTAQQKQVRDKLIILRTQISVYRAEHNGIPPGYPGNDIKAIPNVDTFIAQMTLPTNVAGEVSPAPNDEYRFGPYMDRVPVNPISQSGGIRLVLSRESFPTTPMGDQGWVYHPASGTIAANVEGADVSGVPYFDY